VARSTPDKAAAGTGTVPQYVQRWNLQHRLQHGLLVVSMVLLIGTGFPIKYAYTRWAQWVVGLFGSFENMLALHKLGATLLILAGIYHLVWMLLNGIRGNISWAMVPTWKDVKDACLHAAYLIGLSSTPPQYGRYSYLEKFEYLAVFWGMVVMGGSGLALWFPTVATRFFPRWVLDGLRIVHSNEAFVALLSLAFGHFFFAHLHPDVFPSSPVWYSGKQSLHHLAREHPLELRERVERGELPATALEYLEEAHAPEPLTPARRLLTLVELAVYGWIFLFLIFTFVPLLFT